MVNFINLSYENYLKKYKNYKIICVGAGGTCNAFLKQHADKIHMLNNIICIADNDKCKTGNSIQVGMRVLKIKDLETYSFEEEKKRFENIVLFLLVNEMYAIQVVEQLDKIKYFEGIDCVYGMGTFQWGYSFYPSPKQDCVNLPYLKDEYSIPKIFHYCWFGNKKIPDIQRKCILSWSNIHPEYEVKLWNEENYDLSNAPLYVKEAYEAKKYAFVSDYVRLDVVYKYGGIYLDTDVELYQRIDELEKYRMFFAYMEYGEIGTGLGFGSIKGCNEIRELMDMYNDIPFKMLDGTFNLTPCPRYTNDYFKRKGIITDNSLQINNDILFIPSDYLCPLTPIKCIDGSEQLALLVLTDNTKAVHWCENSWKNKKEREVFQNEKEKLEIINHRLLKDWKRMKGID